MCLNHPFHSWRLMPVGDDEAVRFLMNAGVLRQRKKERLVACLAPACAQEFDFGVLARAGRQVFVGGDELRFLVDFSNLPLVLRYPFKPGHRRASIRSVLLTAGEGGRTAYIPFTRWED